ncbi:MAG: PsbP-related protein [Candidatus Gracilibacteria bacterium]
MQKQKGVSTLIGIIIIIAVVVVLLGGVFTYQYYYTKKSNNNSAQNISTQIASQVENWSLYKDVTNKDDKYVDFNCTNSSKIPEAQISDFESKLANGSMKVLNVNDAVYIYMTPNYENWTSSQFPCPSDGIANRYQLHAYSDKLLWVTGCNGQEMSNEQSKRCDNTLNVLFAYFKNKYPNQQQNNAQPTSQTAGWKTFTNEKYGISIKYPDGWVAKNALGACKAGFPCGPSDLIASGFDITSAASHDEFSNADRIYISYINSPSVFTCSSKDIINLGSYHQEEIIKIEDKKFCRLIYGQFSDIVSYINYIRQKYGDVLTGKYTMGPYFNDAFNIEYRVINSKDYITANVMEYNLGFEIKNALTDYYNKNNSLPPVIDAITPDIWCYDTVLKYQSLINSEEEVAKQIISTFKFTK